jgi:hypothetical protein
MYKVVFWSRLLDKYVVKGFANAKDARLFAIDTKGSLIA